MRSRMERKTVQEMHVDYGPVITISRAYGCPGKLLAQDLAINLNKRVIGTKEKHWKWISKEIIINHFAGITLEIHCNIQGIFSIGNIKPERIIVGSNKPITEIINATN